MDIELNGRGKVTMGLPQQEWSGDNQMQTAMFAGEQAIAITDDAGAFDLRYLGFKLRGFPSMADAKASAPIFAKAVLSKMADMI